MLLFTVNAFDENNFDYIYFHIDSQSSTNKVSYGLSYPNNEEYSFEMYIYYNGLKQEQICQIKIPTGENTQYSKITCEIQKLGEGEYTFEGFLYDKDKALIKKTLNKEYITKDDKNNKMEFISNPDDTTTIIITINTNQSITITNEIPKSVIESLTEENKNSIIKSNIEYEILDEDPLIAWNIEEPPATINYTINKKISVEEQKQFQLKIKNDMAFKGIKYAILAVIVIILILIFRPLYKKDKNEKSK